MFVMSGDHLVNRIGYLISKSPVPEGVDVEVHFPREPEETGDDE